VRHCKDAEEDNAKSLDNNVFRGSLNASPKGDEVFRDNPHLLLTSHGPSLWEKYQEYGSCPETILELHSLEIIWQEWGKDHGQ